MSYDKPPKRDARPNCLGSYSDGVGAWLVPTHPRDDTGDPYFYRNHHGNTRDLDQGQ